MPKDIPLTDEVKQRMSQAQKLSWSNRDKNDKRLIMRKKPFCKFCNKELRCYGSIQCKSCSAKLTLVSRKGKDNSNWKGDKASYAAKHIWMYTTFGKPDTCETCGKSGLHGRNINWANLSGEYKRDRTDWLRLCRSCHAKMDDIGNRSWSTRRGGVNLF